MAHRHAPWQAHDPDLGLRGAGDAGQASPLAEEPEKGRAHGATIEAQPPFRDVRYRTTRRDGTVLYMTTSGKPVFDGAGRFRGSRGVSSDVTAAVRAVQAEEALHQAQAALAHVTRVLTLGEITTP